MVAKENWLGHFLLVSIPSVTKHAPSKLGHVLLLKGTRRETPSFLQNFSVVETGSHEIQVDTELAM